MKIYFLIVSVLALSCRLHNVKGVRLGNRSVSEGHAQKFQGKSSEVVERVKDVVISVAEEAQSSSEGMTRKLMTKQTTSSKKLEGKTNSSKEASGSGHFRVNTSPTSEEILEMDYSPAKKRSPVHN